MCDYEVARGLFTVDFPPEPTGLKPTCLPPQLTLLNDITYI